ncbi:hypothetical protein ARSEF4850_000135 [Beauveria asiatica]
MPVLLTGTGRRKALDYPALDGSTLTGFVAAERVAGQRYGGV